MNDTLHTARRGGIIEEILRTPFFKDILRNNIIGLKYGSGSNLIKTVMGQDPEVFLNMAVSAPSLVNMIIRALTELGLQLKTQYPPATLVPFMESILREIDTGSLKECGTIWKELIGSLIQSSPEAVEKLVSSALASGPAAAAQIINGVSRALNNLEKDRPGALSGFITGVLIHVDRPGASSATHLAAGAVLDQKWHVCSWLFGLAKQRIGKRFTHLMGRIR